MANNNILPSFLDSTGPRGPQQQQQQQQPQPQQQQSQQQNMNNGNGNGNGAGMNGMPMIAGQQMDVNFLYQIVIDLSEALKENREQTAGIIAGAEELAQRAAANGASPSLQEANTEISAGRIAELERQLAREQNIVRVLLDEQRENTKLIGDYEHHLGEIVKDVREYSYNNKTEKTNVAKHYNKLLQDEKDAHLAARLEKDDWHARFMRSVEMLREAYRLRCEEEVKPTAIIQSLQTEVRSLRSALGQEPQKLEEEAGNGWLKDTPDGNAEL
ncbi:hypothetical protein P7C71_g3678, partial [Lecanoromycetidae sp. Uapishka_2]